MGRKRKDQEFIIEEIPGEEDLGELLAMSIVEYINDKAGFRLAKLKTNTKTIMTKALVKFDKVESINVKLRG